MLLVFASLLLTAIVSADRLDSVRDVSLIFVGFRHGERNPFKLFNNEGVQNMSDWGWEGVGELNNVGKMQAFGLGQFLRKRYNDLLPVDYLPYEIEAISSSSKRCQMTLMSMLAGLYPPSNRAKWNTDLAWQPIPFDINDPMLRMENVTCPTYAEAFRSIKDDNSEVSRKLLFGQRSLIDYIVSNTGFNASLKEMGDVADNIRSMIYINAPLPDWIEHPTLEGYTKQSLIEAINQFSRIYQIQCGFNLKCARSTGGLWLNDIVNTLKNKAEGKLPLLKARFYSTHIQTVLSLMRLTGMGVTEMPTSAGIIVEFKPTPPSVRILYHEPLPDQPTIAGHRSYVIQLPYCGNRDWCPLATFLEYAEKEVVVDWQQYCQLSKCLTN